MLIYDFVYCIVEHVRKHFLCVSWLRNFNVASFFYLKKFGDNDIDRTGCSSIDKSFGNPITYCGNRCLSNVKRQLIFDVSSASLRCEQGHFDDPHLLLQHMMITFKHVKCVVLLLSYFSSRPKDWKFYLNNWFCVARIPSTGPPC